MLLVVLKHVKYGGNQFEGTLKGDGVLQVVDTPYGRLSAVICWDADFPDVIRQAGQMGVDILFVPSNDWLELRDIHAGMATFRGLEHGLVIFRQVGQGVSLVSDAYGRVLNRVDGFAAPTGAEDAQVAGLQQVSVPVGKVDTLDPILGDLFGNVMLLRLVGLLVGLVAARTRE